jgi:hypothetical protein
MEGGHHGQVSPRYTEAHTREWPEGVPLMMVIATQTITAIFPLLSKSKQAAGITSENADCHRAMWTAGHMVSKGFGAGAGSGGTQGTCGAGHQPRRFCVGMAFH